MGIMKRIWAFSARRHRELGQALGLAFLGSTLGITQLLAVVEAVRVLTGDLPVRSGLVHVVVLAAICVLGSFALSYFQQVRCLQAGMYSVADQRTASAQRLRHVPLGFFRATEAKNLVATLTTTLQGVEMASTMTIVGIVTGLFNSVAMCLFLFWFDWRFGVLVSAGVAAYLLVVRWQMGISRANAPRRQAAQTGLASAALTFLQGIRVTKAFTFGTGDQELQQAIRESREANVDLTTVSMPSQVSAHLTIAVFETLILLGAVYGSVVTGEFTLEKTILLLIFSFFAYVSLDQAGSILSMAGMLESGLDEVEGIQKIQPLAEETADRAPDSREIVLKDVDFFYGDHQVIHQASAVFVPGTKTAIIGPSGSGKTTLCQLIARFHEVDGGSITLGGVDIRNIPYDTLMEQISMVFQNVYLFEDTVLNNIRFGRPDASLEEVRAAARAARCDEFIMALPEGYDTLVQEGGGNFSGGEKQRISIARAILKDAPIIILDETTSALDAENERAFFDAVEELTRDRTVIMIAHRLSTVRDADQILALEEGRIVQRGTHEELMKQDGVYRRFVELREQAGSWKL